jgi:hypothetical protein
MMMETKMFEVYLGELVKLGKEFINDNIKSSMRVIYEDDVCVILTAGEIMETVLIDQIFNALNFKHTSLYCIKNFYTDGRPDKKTIKSCISKILKDYTYIDDSLAPAVPFRNDIRKMDLVKKIVREIFDFNFNYVAEKQLRLARTISIYDYLEIQLDDRLLEAMLEVKNKPSVEAVKKTYATLNTVMYDPKFTDNIVSRNYRTGNDKRNQTEQLLASRGYTTEVNETIFRVPIHTGFVLGIHDIYGLVIETRSGGKAEMYKKTAISGSEYFSREMQLVCSGIKMIRCDCGNRSTLPITIRTGKLGTEDLLRLAGKHYFEDGFEKIISGVDNSLLGKTLNVRKLSGCQLKNDKEICLSCYGDLGITYDSELDVGVQATTEITATISSRNLQTKHLMSSAAGGGSLHIPQKLASILSTHIRVAKERGYEGNAITFKDPLTNSKRNHRYIVLKPSECPVLRDTIVGDMAHFANPNRLSRITTFGVVIQNGTDEMIHQFDVYKQNNKRSGILTPDFLSYVSRNGFTLDSDGDFSICMDKWDITVPFMKLEDKNTSFSTMGRSFQNDFKYMKNGSADGSIESPELFLHYLSDKLISNDINIPWCMLELIIYCFSIKDNENGDYRLGRGDGPNRGLLPIQQKIVTNSLSVALIHESVMKDVLKNPVIYYGMNSHYPSPMDSVVFPHLAMTEEIIEQAYR